MGPAPPSGPLGPGLGGGRRPLPPQGAPGLAHTTGRVNGVRSGGFLRSDDGWGCGAEVLRLIVSPVSSALRAIGSGGGFGGFCSLSVGRAESSRPMQNFPKCRGRYP